MCKLEINLERYKGSKVGLEFLKEVIQNEDFEAHKELAGWDDCPSEFLDLIAAKYIILGADSEFTETCLAMLAVVVANPKVSLKTMQGALEYTINAIEGYRYHCFDVLQSVAKSKKLTAHIATKLYEVLLAKRMANVLVNLAANTKTPDEILLDMMNRYHYSHNIYQQANRQIIIRYKKLKKQLEQEDN